MIVVVYFYKQDNSFCTYDLFGVRKYRISAEAEVHQHAHTPWALCFTHLPLPTPTGGFHTVCKRHPNYLGLFRLIMYEPVEILASSSDTNTLGLRWNKGSSIHHQRRVAFQEIRCPGRRGYCVASQRLIETDYFMLPLTDKIKREREWTVLFQQV